MNVSKEFVNVSKKVCSNVCKCKDVWNVFMVYLNDSQEMCECCMIWKVCECFECYINVLRGVCVFLKMCVGVPKDVCGCS